MAARECRRRPATAPRAANQERSSAEQQVERVVGLVRQRGEEHRHPVLLRPGRIGLQRPRPGQRDRQAQHMLADPEADQGRAQGRPGAARPALAVAADPLAETRSGREQGCATLRRQDLLSRLNLALLVEVRCHQPLVQRERVVGGLEHADAVDEAQHVIHAQAQPLEHGGEVPGVDRLAVDGGLAADRLEPGAVEQGRPERVVRRRLIEPGQRGGRAREAGGKRGVEGGGRRSQQQVEHDVGLPAQRRRCHGARRIQAESIGWTQAYAILPLPCNKGFISAHGGFLPPVCPIIRLMGPAYAR